jgi:hypothetical protein
MKALRLRNLYNFRMMDYLCTRETLGVHRAKDNFRNCYDCLFSCEPRQCSEAGELSHCQHLAMRGWKSRSRTRKKNLPLNARVAVDWKVIDTTTAAGGVGVSIPGLPVGGSGDISQAREKSTKTVGVPFNLHPDNYAVCTGYKVDIVQGGIGLYDCLMGDNFPNLREALKQEEGTVSCGSVVTVTKKASGNLRFTVLGADLGPSGSYESKNVVDTAYAAPTYRKKKE